MFSSAALGALGTSGQPRSPWNRSWILWYFIGASLVTVIGLRYRVGGDWYSYLHNLDSLRGADLFEALRLGDPAYQALSWLFAGTENSIYFVNSVCALIFSLGLITFCRSLPRPWLALASAIPYMVIVVAMGYTRQSVALGCWMLGLVALQRGSWLRFALWVLLGSTFHKSAVMLLPLPILLMQQRRFMTGIGVAALFALGYIGLLQDSVDALYTNYVEREYQSEGALIRLVMCVIPAIIFLCCSRWLRMSSLERRLWRWISIIALLLLAILFVVPSSTAVDRVALYLLPLQMFVFAHLPDLMKGQSRFLLVLGILLYYAVVQYVWLNYSNYAVVWVPYQLYLGANSV